MTTTKIATCVAIILIFVLIARSVKPKEYEPSSDTIASCRQGEAITKPAFVGTQFEDFDFYQSCLDNIRYANPMNRWAK